MAKSETAAIRINPATMLRLRAAFPRYVAACDGEADDFLWSSYLRDLVLIGLYRVEKARSAQEILDIPAVDTCNPFPQ